MVLSFEWVGVPDPSTGYGKHSFEVLKRLKARGHQIRFIPFSPGKKNISDFFLSLNAKFPATAGKILRINCIPPFPVYAKHRYNILYTMMETLTLHPGVRSRLRTVDEIWTPSKFNLKLFSKNGIPKSKLFLMPEGVDTSRFNPTGNTLDLDGLYKSQILPLDNPDIKQWIDMDKRKFFTILSVFTWSWRKGWDVLLRAFYRAFTPADNVLLVLLTYIPGARGYYTNIQILKDILTIKAQEGIPYHLPILLLTDPISEDQLPALYRSADVFFLPTRGEGFCLPALEAMASGTPPIITKGSGQSMFCNSKNSFLIHTPTVSRYPGDPYQILQFFEHQFFQEPDPDHAAHLLRRAYRSPALVAKKAATGVRDAQSQWSWDMATDKIESRLRYLMARL